MTSLERTPKKDKRKTLIVSLVYTLYALIIACINKIKWTSKATKQVRKLDRPIRVAIIDAIEQLAAMPDCQNVMALTNHLYDYRLRVGTTEYFLIGTAQSKSSKYRK